ncbi:MAG: tRNA (adenosine(37)-N6)-threonylcarbamoyltransferase complex transferase subunit TsaD [Candidatus Terrybacteria bacterium]|nr:tRNA (adenosine(37)-N6)-threonylcarbamoyltransferase complex transferase subunit TsaD [Candidatus Terrybacteria bacterium]
MEVAKQKSPMRILGIETSCDDTCAAIIEARGGLTHPRFIVRGNVVSSQEEAHAPFGGVVPSLAAREHAENIVPVLSRTLRNSRLEIRDLDLIAVTTHPGLLPALLIGVHAARALAWVSRKPIIGIDHLHGHVIANMLPSGKDSGFRIENGGKNRGAERIPSPRFSFLTPHIEFPAVGLIVSGGHTQLVLLRDLLRMRLLGETRDDAAGEAFDKVAKLLGLPFPGGPPLAQLAEQGKAGAYLLPRPMHDSADFDFSFSGLKTAVLYLVQDLKRRGPLTKRMKADIAASFQQAVVDVLIQKTIRAAKKYRARSVILGGGVAANLQLRRQLVSAVTTQLPQSSLLIPQSPFALDNAAMIAAAAYLRWQTMTRTQRQRATWRQVRVRV